MLFFPHRLNGRRYVIATAQATTTLVRGSLRVRMPAAGPVRPADVIPIAGRMGQRTRRK